MPSKQLVRGAIAAVVAPVVASVAPVVYVASVAVVAVAGVAAGCGGKEYPKGSDATETDCGGGIGRSDDGKVVVLLSQRQLIVRQGGAAKVLARPRCLQTIDQWHISPDGKVVGATTHSAGSGGDVFSHDSGPAFGCFVDVASGRAVEGEWFKPAAVTWFDGRALEIPKLFPEERLVWLEGLPVRVPLEARPGGQEGCEVATVGREALVLCDVEEGARLVLRRFADRSWKPVGDDVVLPLGAGGFLAEGKRLISPDGTQLALWNERRVEVIDLATRRRTLALDDAAGRFRGVQLDPAGQGRVMVMTLTAIGEGVREEVVSALWVYDRSGALLRSDRWWGYPEVHWTEPEAVWRDTSCAAGRFELRAK